jgi:hypothetical protein
MKHIALTILSVAGLAAGSARAEHIDVRGNINFGTPAYQAPAYYSAPSPVYVAPSGYWREVVENVWVPPHREVRRDGWGNHYSVWERGHYEARTRRVWVDAYAARRDRERWEHERGERNRWDR